MLGPAAFFLTLFALGYAQTPTTTIATTYVCSTTSSGQSTPSAHIGTWQAEDASGVGVSRQTSLPGYTGMCYHCYDALSRGNFIIILCTLLGTGYIGFDDSGDSITFQMSSGAFESVNDVLITYNSPSGDQYTRVRINGGPARQVNLPRTNGWFTILAGQFKFETGSNMLTLESNTGGYFIDKITLGVAGCAATSSPNLPLSTTTSRAASPTSISTPKITTSPSSSSSSSSSRPSSTKPSTITIAASRTQTIWGQWYAYQHIYGNAAMLIPSTSLPSGGSGWTSPTLCPQGATCVPVLPTYYSQCRP